MSKLGMMCGLWAGLAGAAWGQNLLCNGGFESPQVGADSTMTDVPCWQTSGGQKIELQRKSAQYASGTIGNQHVELDVNTNSDIYQDVATVPGQRYLVRFRMANRTGSPRSAYRILWDGAATGTALRNSTETTFVAVTAEVVATKTVSRIGFAADGPSDGVGDLLDDVTLVPIPAAGSRLGYTLLLSPTMRMAADGSPVSPSSIPRLPGYFAAPRLKRRFFGDDGTELEARQTITLSPAGSTMIESGTDGDPEDRLGCAWCRRRRSRRRSSSAASRLAAWTSRPRCCRVSPPPKLWRLSITPGSPPALR